MVGILVEKMNSYIISEFNWPLHGADVKFARSPVKNGIFEKKEIPGDIYRDHRKSCFVPPEIIIIFL